MPNDAKLIEQLASTLYDHSISGQGRSDSPPWLGTSADVRAHWQDIATIAVAMVRLTDDDVVTRGSTPPCVAAVPPVSAP